jgi:multiple sugar transport system substrate-binding protein
VEKKTLNRRDFLRMTGTVFAGAAVAACAPATPVVIEKEVIKEVPVEKAVVIEKEVPREIIKEVPVEKIVKETVVVEKEKQVEKQVVVTATPPAIATITWAFWGNPGEIETNEAVIKAFEEEHPNVKVAVIHAPWSDFFQKIEVMFAGGTGPDVLFGPFRFAPLGVLRPLDDFVDLTGHDLADYWPGLIKTKIYEGKLYALPRDTAPNCMYYDKDIFDDAGVDYPTHDWTWDDFLTAADKLTIKEASGRVSQYALGMEGGKWRLWVFQQGLDVLDDIENPSKCMLTEDGAIKAIQFFGDLMNKHRYAMRSTELDAAGGDFGALQTKQVATIIQNASRVPVFNTNPDIHYAVSTVPYPADGKRANFLGGAGYGITTFCPPERLDASYEFLLYLQEEGAYIFAETGVAVPARMSVAENSDFLKAAEGMDAFLVEAKVGRSSPVIKEWSEIYNTAVSPKVDLVWTGDKTAEEVVPEICTEVEKMLAEAGYPK